MIENKDSPKFDHSYHDYSNPDPPHQPWFLDFMVRELRKKNCKTVLDVGCGDGNFSASLAAAGFDVYGIDLSPGGVARAKKNYASINGLRFAVASAYDDYTSIFPSQSRFDAIVAVEVIEHLYSPRVLVRRAREAVGDDGMVVVTTPYWGYLKNIVLAVTNRLDGSLTALWDGGHIKHWSYRTLTRLHEEQGFYPVAFHGAGRPVPFLWKGMAVSFHSAPRQ